MRSTLLGFNGSNILNTASTANGANYALLDETTFDESAVYTHSINYYLLSKSTGFFNSSNAFNAFSSAY